MSDLVIVLMHEKGFPMADFYAGHGETTPMEFEHIAPSPDTYFAMKRGNTLEAAFLKAKRKWPEAKIIYAAEDDDDSDED